MSTPRFMAVAYVDDPVRIAELGDDMVAPEDKHRAVCMVQCGPSKDAAELGKALAKRGRRPVSLVVRDRTQAQSDNVLSKLAGAGAVWIFADDLFDAFFTLFATQLAFSLRTNARSGLPVIGIGHGAMAMGGLLLAHRVCGNAQYDLISGLGWGTRVLIDSGADRPAGDDAILQASVRTLPGLLGIDLGSVGAVRMEGGRVESVGSEPITLFGAGDNVGTLLRLPLAPGAVTNIAPPPFAPFERGMLSVETLRALSERRPDPRKSLAPPPPPLARPPTVHKAGPVPHEPAPNVEVIETDGEEPAEHGARMCPMCQQVHPEDGRIEPASVAA
jgi:hypothetical protein